MRVLPAFFASLVLLMATAKKGKCLRCGASSRHTTKLKQSVFFRYLWFHWQKCKIRHGTYSQHFPFFVTWELAQVRVFATGKPFPLSVMEQPNLLGSFVSSEENGVL